MASDFIQKLSGCSKWDLWHLAQTWRPHIKRKNTRAMAEVTSGRDSQTLKSGCKGLRLKEPKMRRRNRSEMPGRARMSEGSWHLEQPHFDQRSLKKPKT